MQRSTDLAKIATPAGSAEDQEDERERHRKKSLCTAPALAYGVSRQSPARPPESTEER